MNYDYNIKEAFRTAHDFMVAHKKTRTPEDWDKAIETGKRLSERSPLTKALILACMDEIEREFNNRTLMDAQ